MFRVILNIAIRNLIAHRRSSVIVGSIIAFGAYLVVLGTGIVDTVDRGLSKTITKSIGGDLQLYSANAKDKLAIYGQGMMSQSEIGKIDNFGTVRKKVEALDYIEAAVPMGVTIANSFAGGNYIDQAITFLRKSLKTGDKISQKEALTRIQKIAMDMQKEIENQMALVTETEELKKKLVVLNQVTSENFQDKLEALPTETLMFLETKLAPLEQPSRILYLRTFGTDLNRFPDYFSTFEITRGEMVPENHRGYLISEVVYEKYLKHKVARELDVIQSERNTYNRLIATDAAQGSRTRLLPNQYKRISYELTSAGAQVIKDFLQIYLKQTQNSLDALLKEFLTIDDDNFDERYNIFYEHIAPHIELYSFNIGDTMTLRSLTKAGYFKAIKVKLYGIFKFKGLEDSDLAGAFCLTDLVSFRELYGVMSQSLKNELSDLKALLQDVDVDDENLEDALFGGDTTLEQSATGFSDATEPLKIERENLPPTYEKTDIDQGLSPHIAIILKDNVDPSESEIALKEFIATSKLELQTSTWQESTGLIGSFVIVLRIVLYVAIFIIFLVALVIINNSMVMNTFERVPEIGTMRAIGAQRIHILALFLLETCILGIFSGVAGMLLGIGSIEILGEVGIQAPTREMTFMFSGPRLYPQLEYSSLIVGFVIVVGASIISTVYPATVAARIEPVIAMQPKE